MPSPVSVLFVSPAKSWRPDGNFGDSHLVALGSYLEARADARVEVIDLDYERYLPAPCPERMFHRGFAVVGISCYSSYDYLTAFYLGREIRRRNPGVILVVGGYHPSARPGDFLNVPGSALEEPSPFDHVVVGEGELPLTGIVHAAARGEKLPEQILGPVPIGHLNELPPMNWSLLDRYRGVARTIGGQFNVPLSRGCPFHCSFCMERAKGESRWRAWSPDRAEVELRRLADWLGRSDWKLFLADAVFGLNPAWRREMLQRLARRKPGFDKIWTLSRIDLLEPGDVERYHRAGFGLGFGLESGDPVMLQRTGKTADPDAFLERFRDMAKETATAGLPWGANVIVGHPGETADSIERSARFALRLFTETDGLTGFLSVDPFRFYAGSLIDRQRTEWANRFGTRIHRPRWWNYSEQAFTSEWVDPSTGLDYRRREHLTARLFGPVVDAVAARFAYRGRAADYFRRSVVRAREILAPPHRLRTLADYCLWQRLTGRAMTRLIDDPEAQLLFREARRRTVAAARANRRAAATSRIAAALIEEPRERYVPADRVLQSWQDVPIPLPADGTATVSALHAYLINYTLLALRAGDRLVEVGGGTGYGAAVAARLVGDGGHVTTFEVNPALAAAAERNLAGRENVTVVCGDGLMPGPLPPLNKALLACAVHCVPQGYLDALPEGGRLVAPIVAEDDGGRQVLTRFTRIEGRLSITRHGDVRYVRSQRLP